MEKVIKGTTFLFKNDLFVFEMNEFLKMKSMFERSQAMLNNHDLDIKKVMSQQYTEMDLLFDVFPVFCISIGGKEMDKEGKRDYIMKIKDMEILNSISETILKIVDGVNNSINQKKKKN